MDTPRRSDEAGEFFLIVKWGARNHLQSAGEKAGSLPPAADGQNPDEPLMPLVQDTFGEITRALASIPPPRYVQALQATIVGMIQEYLRLAASAPRGRQSN